MFGKGTLTWEWEPCVALRSCLPVLPVAALYALLRAAGLDSALAVAYGPRLLQAVGAAAVDAQVPEQRGFAR